MYFSQAVQAQVAQSVLKVHQASQVTRDQMVNQAKYWMAHHQVGIQKKLFGYKHMQDHPDHQVHQDHRDLQDHQVEMELQANQVNQDHQVNQVTKVPMDCQVKWDYQDYKFEK